MFAVIKTGGKQYKVAANDQITVMLLEGDAGAKVTFSEVLARVRRRRAPCRSAARRGRDRIAAEIVEQARGPKVYAFKKRRRKNSKRKRGHKQDLTIIKHPGDQRRLSAPAA